MDAISDLGFFVLLARRGQLNAAAQELGVTPPRSASAWLRWSSAWACGC